MKVFVTGATGFIGSRVIDQLLHAGHEISALVRTEASAKPLAERGVEIVKGDLTSLEAAAEAAKAADSVLHLAFVHDFKKYEESCVIEEAFVTAINKALAGMPHAHYGVHKRLWLHSKIKYCHLHPIALSLSWPLLQSLACRCRIRSGQYSGNFNIRRSSSRSLLRLPSDLYAFWRFLRQFLTCRDGQVFCGHLRHGCAGG